MGATSYDPRADFEWDQVDGDGEGGTCGATKCYFSQPQRHGEAVGWLIRQSGLQDISDWTDAWDLAQDLQAQFGVCHLMLGEPKQRHLTSDKAEQLNGNLFHMVLEHDINADRYKEGTVIMQPVRPCPWPECIMIGCGRHKYDKWKEDLPEFLQGVEDPARLLRAMEESVRSSNAMMAETKCLEPDWQALLSDDGVIFHIDVDRCFDPKLQQRWAQIRDEGGRGINRWNEDCLDDALEMVRNHLSPDGGGD